MNQNETIDMNKDINIDKLIGKYCEVKMNDRSIFEGRLLENYNDELYFLVGGRTMLRCELLDSVKSIKVVDAPKSFIY